MHYNPEMNSDITRTQNKTPRIQNAYINRETKPLIALRGVHSLKNADPRLSGHSRRLAGHVCCRFGLSFLRRWVNPPPTTGLP
jgi:hypothetical protein